MSTMAQSLVSNSGRATVKSGIGKLTAVASGGSTHLTRVSHAAPTRLIPMRLSSVQRAGAAMVAVSSYGGGMLQGDSACLKVKVEEGATLGLTTQGSNRIYKSNKASNTISSTKSMLYPTGDEETTCRSDLIAKVASNGLLVMAPDPCVAFSSSSFGQNQNVHLQEGASAVLVDWFGAGRICNGERWDFRRLSSRTCLYHDNNTENNTPFLVESVVLDQRHFSTSQDPFGFNAGALEFNAFCSVILHGPAGENVVARCKSLEHDLLAKHTRVRIPKDSHQEHELDLLSMSGRVLMGVSKVDNGDGYGSTHVARLAATSNEDIYRVLHSCLQPLQSNFGFVFYKDRIQASATATVPVVRRDQQERNLNGTASQQPNGKEPLPSKSGSSLRDGHATWCAYMLADSGLPTGGFAHSSGIEAASQLGLFGRPNDEELVSGYIFAATRSTTQLLTPFVRAGHELVTAGQHVDAERALETWLQLDRLAHASVASNAPACRASLDQGEGLLRLAIKWLQNGKGKDRKLDHDKIAMLGLLQQVVSEAPQRGHVGPIFGIVCGLLGLSAEDACRVFGFCAARDMVSAAVRLNLVGPLASVSILDSAWDAVNDGLDVALAARADQNDDDSLLKGVMNAAACSPVADAIHPSQDLLSVRLFRT